MQYVCTCNIYYMQSLDSFKSFYRWTDRVSNFVQSGQAENPEYIGQLPTRKPVFCFEASQYPFWAGGVIVLLSEPKSPKVGSFAKQLLHNTTISSSNSSHWLLVTHLKIELRSVRGSWKWEVETWRESVGSWFTICVQSLQQQQSKIRRQPKAMLCGNQGGQELVRQPCKFLE